MAVQSRRKIVSGLLNVRKGEVSLVRSLFFHHFFNGLGTSTFFIAAIALFLNNHSIQDLPKVFILSGIIMFIASIIFTKLEHKLHHDTFNKIVIGLLIGITAISWVGITYWDNFLWSFLIFALFRSVYMFSSLEFWGMSSEIFNIRQSKRLFGLISSGDIPAKVMGYLMVFLLIPRYELSSLFIIAGFAFLASFLFMIRTKEKDVHHQKNKEESSYHINIKNVAFKLIVFLSALAFVYSFSFSILQFVFLAEVKDQAKSSDDLAYFFSVVYAASNVVIVFIKGFFTGRIISHTGLKRVTQMTPLILALIIIIGIAFSEGGISFYVLIILFFMSEVLKYALLYPSFLSMFQPLDVHNKKFAHVLTEGWVEPSAMILSGFFIITLGSAMGAQLILISTLAFLATMVVWILIAQFRFKDYLGVVQQAISRRFVDGGVGFHPEKDSVDILLSNLKNNKFTTVVYCIQLLKENAPKILQKELPALLSSHMPEVRLKAINSLLEIDIQNAKEVLKEISISDVPECRNAALRVMLERNYLAVDELSFYRQFEDSEINYIIANHILSADVNSKNKELNKFLKDWYSSEDIDDNLHFIKLVCKHKLEPYYNDLRKYLETANNDLKEACIRSICKSKEPVLLNLMYEYLSSKETLNIAKNFLNLAGTAILPLVEKELELNRSGNRNRLHVWIRIASGIKEIELSDFLISQFGKLDVYTDKLILRRINRSGWTLKQEHKKILSESFDDLITNVQFHLTNRNVLPDKLGESLNDFVPYLYELIIYHAANERDQMIFNRVLIEFSKGTVDSRAFAMETLEANLPPMLFRRINFLYEQYYEMRHHHTAQTDDFPALIHIILNKNTRWFSKSCVMYCLDYCCKNNLESMIGRLEYHEDKDISDFVKFYNYIKDSNKMKTTENRNNFPFLEKMILLRNSGIFRDTPDHILAEIAAISYPEYLGEAQVIFEMKDPGDCMYMIHSGKVNIESGEHVLAVLGEGDFFGEQSLLDDEPRSATARAFTDCILLKIEQYDFYELMADRSEVMQGVLKIISGRLRRQNMLIVQLKQEIDQLRVS